MREIIPLTPCKCLKEVCVLEFPFLCEVSALIKLHSWKAELRFEFLFVLLLVKEDECLEGI